MSTYIHLLVSICHPYHDMSTYRYCVGVDSEDPLMRGIDVNRWAEPEMRSRLMSLLCEDWLSDDCCIVACEPIDGAVQWQRVATAS